MSRIVIAGEITEMHARIHGPYSQPGLGETFCCATLYIITDTGDQISISYPSPELLIDYCKKINIPIADNRAKAIQELANE